MSDFADRAAQIETRFNTARQAVVDWMNAMGEEGRLVRNGDAPGWPEYEAAERDHLKLREAMNLLGLPVKGAEA